MTFCPKAGLWSREDFSTSGNHTATAPTLQNVTGGVVSLLPQIEQSFSYVKTWSPVTGWTMENNLHSLHTITGDFIMTTGADDPALQTGRMGPVIRAGAWQFITPDLLGTGNFSGQTWMYASLETGSPDTAWHDSVVAGGPFTLEFEVQSLEQVHGSVLPGFQSGQSNLTGLPILSGKLNHGIYIQTTQNWDFLEVNPGGIRSMSHPELAIPIDLRRPKKIRVGIAGESIFILAEDGRGVAGVGKFDRDLPSLPGSPRLSIGAPDTGNINTYGFSTASGFVGHSVWYNFRVLTGNMVLDLPSGVQSVYPTGVQTFYTNPFDPTIPIAGFVSATIGFISYQGGDTVVTAQKSGSVDWQDIQGVTLGGTSPAKIDLSSHPAENFDPLRKTGTLEYHHPNNHIRFKIEQNSTSGLAPSSAVDFIEVLARKEEAVLDVLPNWKPITHPLRVQFAVKSGDWFQADPRAGSNTTFLYNTPVTSGSATGQFRGEGIHRVTGNIVGTGEYVFDGPYGPALQNYQLQTLTPATGTSLANIFGTDPIENLFPNPQFDQGFQPVNQLPGFVSGKLFGEIADWLEVPPSFTGAAKLTLRRKRLFKPGIEARRQWENSFLGYQQMGSLFDYGQNVVVEGPANQLNVGIECVVPSGEDPETAIFRCDLSIPEGTGVHVFVTGSMDAQSVFVPGSMFRDFRPFAMVLNNADGDGEIRIGLVSPTGVTGRIEYNIDNVEVRPLSTAHLQATGVVDFLHTVGRNASVSLDQDQVRRSSTVVATNLFLDAYPTTSGTVFKKARDLDGRGITISINQEGYPVADYDMYDQAWAPTTALPGTEEFLGKFSITGSERVPLGRWMHLGFIHQQENYPDFGSVNTEDGVTVNNFAASNRTYLTIDGAPVATQDVMYLWPLKGNLNSNDTAPWASYIATGQGEVTVASGLFCRVDGVQYDRPPIGDAENWLSIYGARNCAPYFVPSVMLKPNLLTSQDNPLGNIHTTIGSIYNLWSPAHTNWDHGEAKNHLLFFGNPSRASGVSPYTGYPSLGSTYFPSGSHAKAPYSSSTDRLLNHTGNLGITGLNEWGNDGVSLGAWVRPKATGIFYEIVQDEDNPEQDALVLGLDGDSKFFAGRRLADGTYAWRAASSSTSSLDQWSHVAASITLGGSWNTSGDTSSLVMGLAVDGTTTASIVQPSPTANYGFHYYGKSGDTQNSAIYLARDGDFHLADAFLCYISPTDPTPLETATLASKSGNKRGFYNVLMRDQNRFTGNVDYLTFDYGHADISNGKAPGESLFWVSANGGYAIDVQFNDGFALYDENTFREVQGYYLDYDDRELRRVIGETTSPIRLGFNVPPGAINLARIDSPRFSVDNAVNTLDLSDQNTHNLTTYRGGIYTVDAGGQVSGSGPLSGDLQEVVGGTGRVDVTFSGQLATRAAKITSISAVHPSLSTPEESFYYYCLGRGDLGVRILDAQPHPTGQWLPSTTGATLDPYIENLERLRRTISLKGRNGRDVPIEEFPWDLVYSPFSPQRLDQATANNENLPIEGFASGLTGLLPDGVFSVVLVSKDQVLPNQETLWVHYPSYDFQDQTENRSHREIANFLPLMRERSPFETPQAGQFEVLLNPEGHKNYSLKVYGILSGFSGSL